MRDSASPDSGRQMFSAHEIETFLANGDHISIIASVLAVVAAGWTAIISRRGVRLAAEAAEIARDQAKAAADLAKAAQEQAQATYDLTWKAESQDDTARKAAAINALIAAHEWIDRNAPAPAYMVSSVGSEPMLTERIYDLPIPHPDHPPRATPIKLDRIMKGHYDLYFIVRGLLFNDSDRAMRAITNHTQFIPGIHPVTGEPIPVPPRADTGGETFMLFPGQAAAFQWLAYRQVDDWTNIRERRKEQHHDWDVRGGFVFVPGAADKPMSFLDLHLQAEPLEWSPDKHQRHVEISADCYVRLTYEYSRKYPKSAEHFKAELEDDHDKLYELSRRDEHERLAREAMQQPDAAVKPRDAQVPGQSADHSTETTAAVGDPTQPPGSADHRWTQQIRQRYATFLRKMRESIGEQRGPALTHPGRTTAPDASTVPTGTAPPESLAGEHNTEE
jgi:hypothetical protein